MTTAILTFSRFPSIRLIIADWLLIEQHKEFGTYAIFASERWRVRNGCGLVSAG